MGIRGHDDYSPYRKWSLTTCIRYKVNRKVIEEMINGKKVLVQIKFESGFEGNYDVGIFTNNQLGSPKSSFRRFLRNADSLREFNKMLEIDEAEK